MRNNCDTKEQAIKVKLKIENLLESLNEQTEVNINGQMGSVEIEITKLEKKIKKQFNLNSKRNIAEKFINRAMELIGKHFDFEKTYKPVNLKFSLQTFELYHEKSNEEKIYLRSMGSGQIGCIVI